MRSPRSFELPSLHPGFSSSRWWTKQSASNSNLCRSHPIIFFAQHGAWSLAEKYRWLKSMFFDDSSPHVSRVLWLNHVGVKCVISRFVGSSTHLFMFNLCHLVCMCDFIYQIPSQTKQLQTTSEEFCCPSLHHSSSVLPLPILDTSTYPTKMTFLAG